MTKEELLLNLIEKWWGCQRESELSEALMGAGGTSPDDVRRLYPNALAREEQIREDVRRFFQKIRANLDTLRLS